MDKNLIPQTVWISEKTLAEINAGKTSRGGMKKTKDGRTVFKRYNLGEGKPLGPKMREKEGGTPATLQEIFIRLEIYHYYILPGGQVTVFSLAPNLASADDAWMELLTTLYNLNKGGKHANN